MNIIVCLKQVPDVDGKITVEKGGLHVEGLVSADVTSSLDLYAVELALALKDKKGGTVILVSIGKETSEISLRQGLALGANEAVLLVDPVFENMDSFLTATILAKAIASLPHDLIICGQRADDTQSGLTGAYLAQLLGVPVVRNVLKAELPKEALQLTRKLERGNREMVETALPALLTVEASETRPRHATIKGYLRAKNASVRRIGATDLGITPGDFFLYARTRTINLTPPKPKMKGLFVPDTKMTAADKMKAIMGGGLVQKKSNFLEGEPEKIAQQVAQFLRKEKIIPG